MRLGIPVWGDRVSPVLDAAARLVVVDLDEGGEPTEVALGQTGGARRASAIAGLGLDVLICGAVTAHLANLLEASGVRVVPWVSGTVDDVVSAFREDALSKARFSMPGCRCGRGRRRHGGGGKGRRR